jgi:hypothetical protein
MIYLALKGRLGNQLCQLGAALRLAKGDVNKIRIDPVNLAVQSNPNYVQASGYRLGKLFANKILPGFIEDDRNELFKGTTVYKITDPDRGVLFDQVLLDSNVDLRHCDIILDGYFQSGKNLFALRNYLLSISSDFYASFLNFPPQKIEAQTIAHFRLGDYLLESVQREIGLLNLSYLDSAIEKYWKKQEQLFIYSDGEEIRRRYEKKSNISVITGGDEIETFTNLMNCKTLIVPNSTFSLCAAFLSPTIETLVRPFRWTRNSMNDQLTDSFQGEVDFLTNRFTQISI